MTTIIVNQHSYEVDDAYEREEVCGHKEGSLIVRFGKYAWKNNSEYVVGTNLRTETEEEYLRRHPDTAMCLFLDKLKTIEDVRTCEDKLFAASATGGLLDELSFYYRFACHSCHGQAADFIARKCGLKRRNRKWVLK